jgi:sphingolipid delta-4 desaturase
MATATAHFVQSSQNQPHPGRTQEILRKYPQIGKLIGTRNPFTFAILLGVVGLQTGIAALIGYGHASDAWYGTWWMALLAAYLIGAFANHTLYVVIHEATHNLIFKSRFLNKVSGVLADLPNVFPGSMGFRNYHIKHHAHQGDYHQDADMASHWEAKLIGNSPLGKAFWFLIFPIFQLTRPPRLQVKFWDGWLMVNLFTILAYDGAVLYFFGWTGFLYMVASFFFSIGLHPLGARWIQEHYIVFKDQETYSYYGPLNLLSLNVGYHNEHHDFPAVPWNKLPEIRRIAPEYYDTLHYHTSMTKLFFRFIFDPNMSLYSRVERIGEGKVSHTAA